MILAMKSFYMLEKKIKALMWHKVISLGIKNDLFYFTIDNVDK
jgi:hypothetical protein